LQISRIKNWLLSIAAFVLLALLALLFSRNLLLQYVVKKFERKLFKEHSLLLKIDKVYFEHFNEIKAENISLTDDYRNEIFNVKSANVALFIPQLLLGNIRLESILMSNFRLNFLDSAGVPFYHKIKPLKENGISVKTQSKKFAAQRLLKLLKVFANTEVVLQNNVFCFQDSLYNDTIFIPHFTLHNRQFSAIVADKNFSDTLFATGNFDIKNEHISCSLRHSGNKIGVLTVVEKMYDLSVNFDSLFASLKWNALTNNDINFALQARVHNSEISHWRLAAQPVALPFLQADFAGSFTANSLHLDSSSQLKLNKLPIYFFAHFQREDTNYKATLKMNMPEVDASVFFESLPQGMFKTLEGIECSGKLAYQLNFAVDSKQLDSLIFNSDLKRKNFYVKNFGAENFLRINDDFLHDVIVKEQVVRKILVGHDNPNFTSLRQVSPLLISSVLQSEDPSFLQHNGFIESAFRESIIQNIRERRFARGGSTITMQLMKNVFLNRNKNIARKVEEALIVYLIENLRLVSKERMLEVYLNIIEWGPNVYGIGEAASFYFHKKPSELNLAESVFLAGIIPNPKYFKYQIQTDGTFKPHFQRYAEILINRMLIKGRLSESDALTFQPKILLKGEASKAVSPALELNAIDNPND
jgi:hypothetical protein